MKLIKIFCQYINIILNINLEVGSKDGFDRKKL